MGAFANEPAHDPLQGPVGDLHHHAFMDEGTRIVLKLALNQAADAFDLLLRDRRDLTVEGDDVDDAVALQDREPVGRVEPREAVAGEERPVDLLLAILPAAPFRQRRQERFEAFLFELLSNDLFVTRPCPDRVPLADSRH